MFRLRLFAWRNPRLKRNKSALLWELRGESGGIPPFAKNAKDGAPVGWGGDRAQKCAPCTSTCHRQASLLKSETWATHSNSQSLDVAA